MALPGRLGGRSVGGMELPAPPPSPTSAPWKWWTVWLASALGWTAYGLLYAYQEAGMLAEVGNAYDWAYLLKVRLVGMWGWIPLTVSLFWLSARFTIRRKGAAAQVAWLMAGAIAMVFLRALYIYALDPWIHWYESPPDFWRDVMPTSLQNNLLISWIVIGLAHAVLYFDRAHAQERLATELQARLTQARLDAISAQLNPHFLFNALNSIAEMVHVDAKRADEMLVALSELLRRSLDRSRRQWVSLRDELGLLRQYLVIEKVRLGDRMQVHWHVAEECLDELVPPLLLQPLVENAVVHAIARRLRPGTLRIGAGFNGAVMWLDVEDDGADAIADIEGHGIGLANTRARLEALYGGAASLEVLTNPSGGTRVSLQLPRTVGRRSVAEEGPPASPALQELFQP